MRVKHVGAALALLLVALVPVVMAGDSTLSYTAAQSTAIQNRVIPRYNADHCRQFGLPVTCSTAELVAAGCTVQTTRTFVTDSCTIFASSAAGEAAFLKEMANQGGVATFNRLVAEEINQYNSAACTLWKALSPAAQQSDCVAKNQPATCSGPCP